MLSTYPSRTLFVFLYLFVFLFFSIKWDHVIHTTVLFYCLLSPPFLIDDLYFSISTHFILSNKPYLHCPTVSKMCFYHCLSKLESHPGPCLHLPLMSHKLLLIYPFFHDTNLLKRLSQLSCILELYLLVVFFFLIWKRSQICRKFAVQVIWFSFPK